MQGFPQPSQSSEQEKLKCPRCDSSNTKFCYYNNYNLSQPRHFCKSCRRYWTKGGALRNIPVGGGSRKNSKRGSATAAKRPASSDDKSETFLSLKGDNGSGQGQFGDFTEGVGRNETLSPLKEDDFFGQGHFGGFAEMSGRNERLKGDGFGLGQFGGFSGMSGSFSSLLASSSSEAQYGSLLDGLGPNGLSLQMSENFGDPGPGQNVDPHGAGFLNIGGGGGGGYWGGGGGDGGCWGGGGDWPDLAM